ncbi:autotransporter secretion outer membrane protein TamA [Nitrosomonas marina]|uniref:Autotransporter secretion outer membrane protein TamA n=1 Tax=Nitrosomonas marina TaxID=917 RepID=A0A1H9YIT1_9PROT|nr:autotransporter assembly complex family protein [Nitrosomonas marina]SES68894.1 autotransporter secretion outer membrane protein TamA [Nitrosomonas marina]
MLRKRLVINLFALCFSMLAVSSNPILAETALIPNITGPAEFARISAPDDVQKFLKEHIKLPEEPFANNMAQRTFLRRTKHEIIELLSTQGYFSPTVTFDKRISNKVEIPVIVIDPGPMANIRSVEIEFQGSIADDETQQDEIKKWRKAWPLKVGKPFLSADWEEAKAVLLSQVSYKKFAAARIVKSEAVVDKENAQVALYIVIDSGPVFYFGELEIDGLERYDPEMIENHRPFRTGEPYSKELMHRFQIALQNIPHFGNVSVNIDPDVSKHNASPIYVTVTETKSQRIAVGGGYSSNNGARAEVNYSNHNFLDRAWNFSTLLRLEQKRQTFFSGVNTLPNENNIYYALGATVQRTDIEDLVTVRQRVDAARIYQTYNTQWQYSLNWQREEKRPDGAINQTVEALAFDWRYRYHIVDDPVNIRRGNVSELRIGGGLDSVFSDQDFLRLYGRQQNWWPVGKRDVFYLRGEAGYTLASSRFGIPQEYLFRAGGIQSVRGYDFLSIGVREGNAIVGGRVLATGTAEYTHWFMRNWGAAAFVDAGSAADTIEDMDLFLGYGAGVRWRSPAGPLALDLARGHKTGTFRVHFSMVVNF